jgi:S-adenosylmethionine hydrolase
VFADAEPGTAFWYENSSGLVEIAVSRGSAARDLGLVVGMPVSWVA